MELSSHARHQHLCPFQSQLFYNDGFRQTSKNRKLYLQIFLTCHVGDGRLHLLSLTGAAYLSSLFAGSVKPRNSSPMEGVQFFL